MPRELVVSGQFICEVTDQHNCAGGGPEVGGAHESWCGLEPIVPLAQLRNDWKAGVRRIVYFHPTPEPVWEWYVWNRTDFTDHLSWWYTAEAVASGASYDWSDAYHEAHQAVLHLMVTA